MAGEFIGVLPVSWMTVKQIEETDVKAWEGAGSHAPCKPSMWRQVCTLGAHLMTSEERKENRYRRRKARRDARRREAGSKTFEEVFSFGNVHKAGKQSCKGVRWKTSTILFEVFLCQESLTIRKELKSGKRRFKGFHSFMLVEHGKTRAIDALPIRDRAAQKCMVQNLLTDAYTRSFIVDNSASLKNKGMDYALRRLKSHLREHGQKHGLEGGIYQYDFKGYFASIPHNGIKERARERIEDDKLFSIFCAWVDDFNLLQTADPKDEMKRGVGLGSENSQLISLDYANPIDHFIKDECGIRGYGRYMDDGYIISDSLKELKRIKAKVYAIAESIGLKMSDKKNTITPFKSHSFSFLKMRFALQKGKKVTMKLGRKSIRTTRRKLAVFRRWVTEGKIDAEDVFASYQAWRAHARRAGSFDTLQAMDERFASMFREELEKRRLRFPCTLKAIRTNKGWKYIRKTRGRKETRWNTSAIIDSGGLQLGQDA